MIKVRTRVLYVLVLVAAIPLLGRESTDVIVMKNGDHLTGEIKGLNQGVLYISMNYILGTSEVQWSQVDHIESKQLFLVKTESGNVYTGALSTAEAAQARPMTIEVVESSSKQTAIERPKVVEMDQTSERFWQRFNGEINSGISYTKGNQTTQYSLSSNVSYPRERWSAAVSYNSNLSTSTGVAATTRNQVNLTGQRLLRWNNWFYAGTAGFLQSSEQDINLQTSLGGGVGRLLSNTNHAKIYVMGGFAWQRTQYAPNLAVSNPQEVFTGMVGAGARLFRFNKTTLDTTLTLLPAITEPGRLYTSLNATYYIKITGSFSWNVSFYGNWDNQPPPTFSGSDYGTSSGLSITFGNR
ncbi:MAG TPA: DUF481 domain-containing protein [Candidatus Bathyarchaeia archaeon]|nr:DUF481 domain-containing protein [Candidatus Bathyarchaeia archaeon]